MADREPGKPMSDETMQISHETTPLTDFQLQKEVVNNESAIQQLAEEYDLFMDQYYNWPTEDLAIELINLQKQMNLIGANQKDAIDARTGVLHPRKHEIIN